MEQLTERLYDLFRPVVQEQGLDLVDVEYVPVQGGRRLSVYITQTEGNVSLDDCANVARALDELLEATPELRDTYTLEVASPGLDRVFKRDAEYDMFRGRQVKVRIREPIDGKYELEGELKGRAGEQIELETPDGSVSVALANIKKTKLIFKMK